jgi:hypothetical protein
MWGRPCRAATPLPDFAIARRKTGVTPLWRRRGDSGTPTLAKGQRLTYHVCHETRRDAPGQGRPLSDDDHRDDGVSYVVSGVAHNFAIPHDVAHFVVEGAVRLHCAFWGSVAGGAVFRSMTYASGRRKPAAAQRSEGLLKANADHLNEAEALVRIFNDTIEQGHPESSAVLRSRLNDRLWRRGQAPREITAADVSKVYAAYSAVRESWRRVPIGGNLDLMWESTSPRAHRHDTKKRGRGASARSREVVTLGDVRDEDIAALESTRAPESARAFDYETET